jgi:phosphatidylserine decarboxylase
MTIHKEGFRILSGTVIVLVALNVLIHYLAGTVWFVTVPVGILSGFVLLFELWFFRIPNRTAVTGENIIIAPADGKVVVIEETVENEYFNEKRIQVSIFMSPLNVHVNRYPVSGEVTYYQYHKGDFLVAWHPKSSTLNERTTLVLRNTKGVEVLVRQIAGAVARRIVAYSKVNMVVNQGDELGFIKFGSRVDLFLPLNTKINVEVNQKVCGNKTIIGYIE